MTFLANVFWIVFGGWLSALVWILAGCLWCLTIVGIPVGLQCFKLSGISFSPFGKEVRYEGGAASFLLNVVWFIVSGWELAVTNLVLGCLLCCSIIGIPWGMQYFKIAKLSLAPFGAVVDQIA